MPTVAVKTKMADPPAKSACRIVYGRAAQHTAYASGGSYRDGEFPPGYEEYADPR